MEKDRKNDNKQNIKGKETIWKDLIRDFACFLGVDVIITSFAFVCLFLGQYNLFITGENRGLYLTIFVSHCSIVFLTSSLMTMLSEGNKFLYWKDLVYEVLILPRFWSFFDLVTYAISSLIIAALGLFFKLGPVVISSFVLGIVAVGILFYRMVTVYYGNEKRKKNLKEELLLKIEYDYKEDGVIGKTKVLTQHGKKIIIDGEKSYITILKELREKTYILANQRKFNDVYENLNLLEECIYEATFEGDNKFIYLENIYISLIVDLAEEYLFEMMDYVENDNGKSVAVRQCKNYSYPFLLNGYLEIKRSDLLFEKLDRWRKKSGESDYAQDYLFNLLLKESGNSDVMCAFNNYMNNYFDYYEKKDSIRRISFTELDCVDYETAKEHLDYITNLLQYIYIRNTDLYYVIMKNTDIQTKFIICSKEFFRDKSENEDEDKKNDIDINKMSETVAKLLDVNFQFSFYSDYFYLEDTPKHMDLYIKEMEHFKKKYILENEPFIVHYYFEILVTDIHNIVEILYRTKNELSIVQEYSDELLIKIIDQIDFNSLNILQFVKNICYYRNRKDSIALITELALAVMTKDLDCYVTEKDYYYIYDGDFLRDIIANTKILNIITKYIFAYSLIVARDWEFDYPDHKLEYIRNSGLPTYQRRRGKAPYLIGYENSKNPFWKRMELFYVYRMLKDKIEKSVDNPQIIEFLEIRKINDYGHGLHIKGGDDDIDFYMDMYYDELEETNTKFKDIGLTDYMDTEFMKKIKQKSSKDYVE